MEASELNRIPEMVNKQCRRFTIVPLPKFKVHSVNYQIKRKRKNVIREKYIGNLGVNVLITKRTALTAEETKQVMKRTVPKLVLLHRCRLSEAQERLDGLVRLKEDIARQLPPLTESGDPEAVARAQRLKISSRQIEQQIEAERAQIAENRRVLRVLESRSASGEPFRPDTALSTR